MPLIKIHTCANIIYFFGIVLITFSTGSYLLIISLLLANKEGFFNVDLKIYVKFGELKSETWGDQMFKITLLNLLFVICS